MVPYINNTILLLCIYFIKGNKEKCIVIINGSCFIFLGSYSKRKTAEMVVIPRFYNYNE